MNVNTRPTIQEVIDQAKLYCEQGISRAEAIRRAINSTKQPVLSKPNRSRTYRPVAFPLLLSVTNKMV